MKKKIFLALLMATFSTGFANAELPNMANGIAKVEKTKAEVKAVKETPKAEVAKATKESKAKVAKVKETKAPKAPQVAGEKNGKKIMVGPKGGKYYINANGKKTYVK